MTKTLAALLLVAWMQGPPTTTAGEFSPEVMLKPRSPGRISIALNTDARAAFESIAERTGLNLVFYRGLPPDARVSIRIQDAPLVDALDALALQTGTFWFPWDGRTIVVGAGDPATRRNAEPTLLKTIYLNEGTTVQTLNTIVNSLRVNHQMRGVFQNEGARAIVIKDTPSRVALAERELGLVSTSTPPMRMPEMDTTFLSIAENGSTRRVTPSNHAQLEKALASTSVSMDRNQSSRLTYEELAARASLNIVFDSRNTERPVARFHVEHVGLVDALDLLALQSGTFWQPLNETTIFVADDTAGSRRDLEALGVKVIYFSDGISVNDRNAILNVLRTVLSLRYVFQTNSSNAIVIRDTPLRIFMAERIVADLDRGGRRSPAVSVAQETSSFLTQGGWVLGNAKTARPNLGLNARGRVTVHLNEPPRAAFQALARQSGLEVQFDPRVAEGGKATPLDLTNVDVLEALDLVSVQTRHFWQVVDSRTIRVIPSTVPVRQELEPRETRPFPAPGNTTAEAEEATTILRTVLGLREVNVDPSNRIVIRDTAENLAMSQLLLEKLAKRGN